MKFIDKIISKNSDNNIYWLWKSDINKHIYDINLSYNNSITKYYNYKNIVNDTINYYKKKNKYPDMFIFVLPPLDIYFFRLLVEIKDGLMIYEKNVIFFNMPHLFVISHRKPDIKLMSIYNFSIYFLSDQ